MPKRKRRKRRRRRSRLPARRRAASVSRGVGRGIMQYAPRRIGTIVLYAVGILAGRIVRALFDAPWVSEVAVGFMILAIFVKRKRADLVDFAWALQSAELIAGTGIVDTASKQLGTVFGKKKAGG